MCINNDEDYLHKQHTPNPDAQTPAMLPPNLEQSDEL